VLVILNSVLTTRAGGGIKFYEVKVYPPSEGRLVDQLRIAIIQDEVNSKSDLELAEDPILSSPKPTVKY
jgi:predicted RNA-binding protein with PUA domain